MTDREVQPVPYLISNFHQPWLDHTTYARNEDEFIGRLAMEIAAAAHPEAAVEHLARWQHRDGGTNDASAPDDVVNGTADAARRSRQVRGWWLLGAQLTTIVGAIAMLVWHHERIRRLGSWIAGRPPERWRSWLDDRIDGIPGIARDVALGSDRNPHVFYGASMFIVVLLLLLLTEWLIIAAAQRRAGAAYANRRVRASQALDRTDVAAILTTFLLTLVPVLLGVVVQMADLGHR